MTAIILGGLTLSILVLDRLYYLYPQKFSVRGNSLKLVDRYVKHLESNGWGKIYIYWYANRIELFSRSLFFPLQIRIEEVSGYSSRGVVCPEPRDTYLVITLHTHYFSWIVRILQSL